MNIHENAGLTPRGREVLISRLERGEHPIDVATAMGVSVSTVYKWRRRHLEEGGAGLRDRSSRPHASPNRTPDDIEAKVIALRKERRIYSRIAKEAGVSRATVGRILTRHGLNRWRDLEPCEPVRRYERDRPGEMIHIDIKKLGRFDRVGHRITKDRTGQSNSRGIGWEYVHVCIDDHSRLGMAEIMPDEKKESAVAFLKAAIAWYAQLGIAVPTTVPATAPRRSGKPARHRGCATSSQNHTPPGQTGRPSASYSRPCANGPTQGRIKIPAREPGNSRTGYIITIGTDHMPG